MIRRLRKLAVPLVAITMIASAAATPRITGAATTFALSKFMCKPTSVCGSPSIAGIDIDTTNNIVFAVDTNNTQLLRFDGSTDTFIDRVALANCNDPRPPAVAHVAGVVKIYVGCEDAHTVQVLSAGTNGRAKIALLTTIPLAIGATMYEPKTERASDAAGKVLVVGDALEGATFPCADPAFAISTATDTIVATNTTLGTTGLGSTVCSGYEGINDAIINPHTNTVFWPNEDDGRMYQTDFNLKLLNKSYPAPVECSFMDFNPSVGKDTPVREDSPKTGAFLANGHGLATAPEASSPCVVNPENGAIYGFTGVPGPGQTSFELTFRQTPSFGAGMVAAADPYFLITNTSTESGLFGCAISCVQVRDQSGNVVQSIGFGDSPVAIAYNPMTGKAYVGLGASPNPNMAVIISR